MIILLLFSFIGGLVTILSPCILPLLPIVLSTGVTGGKKKPLGVVTGFVVSFTLFTSFLTAIVKATGLSADFLRTLAALVILAFGLVLVVPQLNLLWERLVSRLASRGGSRVTGDGFSAGLLVGISLGLVWTPCVGPIMAAIITLAATGQTSASSVPIVLAYSLGTAIPLLAIVMGSRRLMKLTDKTVLIQKVFGLLMIATALAIYLNLDRQFQAWVLNRFPGYGTGLTSLEDNPMVEKELKRLQEETEEKKQGINLKNFGPAPELDGWTHWVNSEPLTLAGLRGKVVLVDFWTYSCINCIRTLPYLTSWYQKYADSGLVIIGVHSPEFEFEKDTQNVIEAMEDFGVTYPVVQDNDFNIWRAYNNRYWPAKYLIDKQGRVRYTHFGEGQYAETEKNIQLLLGETDTPMVDLQEYQSASRTPETYLGYGRLSGYASLEDLRPDQTTAYTAPDSLQLNQVAFSGQWLIAEEHAEPEPGARLSLRFDAKQVNLVMDTAAASGRVRVFLDGREISIVSVDSARLYNLVELATPGDHTLTLEFLDSGLQLFAFTFG